MITECHGAAVHYSTSDTEYYCSPISFLISNCNFTSNEGAKSLVYVIENRFINCNNNITFQYCKFCYNEGVSIYAVNHNLHLNEEILFLNNTAESGAGIYIRDYSSVTFGKNADVTFIQNSAKYGGAIFLINQCSVLFDQNSVVAFKNNGATNGTVYAEAYCNVIFNANCHVTFSGNSATQLCAAIYSSYISYVTFTGNSVTFSGNIVLPNEFLESGGILCSGYNSYIIVKENSTLLFNKNNVKGFGGAIISYINSFVSFEGASNIVFSDNNAGDEGGAIFVGINGFVSFKDHSATVFRDNTAGIGAALSSFNYSSISFEGNSVVTFSNNRAIQGGLYPPLIMVTYILKKLPT